MSDAESTLEVESHDAPKQETQDRKPTSAAANYSLWPPTERTRKAVVDRLIETLTTPSPLSRRYGTLSADEADSQARRIEQDAFAAAGGSAATEVGESGMNILQIYSKEISKRMLEVVKAKSIAASAADNGASETAETGSPAVAEKDATAAEEDAAAAVPGEEVKDEEVKTEEST